MHGDEILKRAENGMKESNKILIQELIQDLEEKGISPVIAVNGEVKKLSLIKDKQLQNFEQELQKFGMNKSDFCLLQENEEKPTSDFKNIILIHKKSAKLKTYKTKDGSWVAALHHDLENKFFTNAE